MKKRIIWIAVIALVLVGAFFIGKYIVIDYVFDKYILENTLSAMKDTAPATTLPPEVEATPEAELQETTEPQETAAPKKKVDNMTTGEVAAVVAQTPELIRKLESIVSHADKERVMSIALSNFTKDEIAHYSSKVAGGMTPALKSELMNVARSRLTSAQWSECLNIFSKYVEQLKPYME